MKGFFLYIGETYYSRFAELNPESLWIVYNLIENTSIDTFFLTFKQ